MSINQNVDLNLSASIMPPVLHMAQGDSNSRTIVATLWDGTSRFTIPSDAVVMVRFGKPDGTGGLYDHAEAGTAITYSGNVVTAPVATQMLSVAGKVQADIEIYQTGATAQAAVKLATFAFVVNVEKSPYPDDEIISSDYYNVLSSQIAAAVEAGAKADQAVQAAQQATEAASSASQSQAAAASSAQSASQSMQTASSAASSAASAKESAASSASAAAQGAQSASRAAAAAMQDADDAEAWAVGKRNGADVPSTDPAYHNNAKYYKDQAQTVVGDKVNSFNGRIGTVVPQEGDYTAEMVGAQPLLTPGDNISISGSVIATKAFPCNPNLLDNWYFGNPVNQRGQTSYTGGGYGIDRWFTSAEETTVAVVTGGISVSGKRFQRLEQRVEDAQSLNGITVTLSALVKKPNGNFRLALYNATTGDLISQDFQASEDFQLVQITAAPVINAGDVFSVALYPGANDATTERTCLIKAVKLELGPQQTLAHQENGVWVLNEIPNYGEQLRRCHRYFQVIQQYSAYPAAIDANGNLLASIVPPVEMRIIPVFSRANINNNIIDVYFATGGHTGVATIPAVSGSPGFVNLNFKSIPGETHMGAIARFVDRAFLSADL